jgi:hypothetical protein
MGLHLDLANAPGRSLRARLEHALRRPPAWYKLEVERSSNYLFHRRQLRTDDLFAKRRYAAYGGTVAQRISDGRQTRTWQVSAVCLAHQRATKELT